MSCKKWERKEGKKKLTEISQKRRGMLHFVFKGNKISHLCTNCAARSSHRIGWPDWFLV